MTLAPSPQHAHPWLVDRWFNAPLNGLDLADLQGRPVALVAFQMLCPGCVLHGIPQAQRLHDRFAADGLVVVGLHSVFEHHEAMNPRALDAFLHEYRVTFPVAVDRPSSDGDPRPLTMRRYAMRGTPSLILIDRAGTIREHYFGRPSDLEVGAAVGALVGQLPPVQSEALLDLSDCTDEACPI